MRIAATNDYRIGKINGYQKVGGNSNSIMQKRNSGHGGTNNNLHENH